MKLKINYKSVNEIFFLHAYDHKTVAASIDRVYTHSQTGPEERDRLNSCFKCPCSLLTDYCFHISCQRLCITSTNVCNRQLI